MNTKIFAVLAIVLIALAIVSSAYAPSLSDTSYHTLGGDCLADNANGDMIYKADWYCNPVRGDYIRLLPMMDTVDRQQTETTVVTVVSTPPTVQTEIQPPTDNTPPAVVLPSVNPPTEKHTKHANNGGGNGSEMDSNGNDIDPNTNKHANKHD